jgi:hypothetical protein
MNKWDRVNVAVLSLLHLRDSRTERASRRGNGNSVRGMWDTARPEFYHRKGVGAVVAL